MKIRYDSSSRQLYRTNLRKSNKLLFVFVFLPQSLNLARGDILYLDYLLVVYATAFLSDVPFYLCLIQFLYSSDPPLVYMTPCLGTSWTANLYVFVSSRLHAGDISVVQYLFLHLATCHLWRSIRFCT